MAVDAGRNIEKDLLDQLDTIPTLRVATDHSRRLSSLSLELEREIMVPSFQLELEAGRDRARHFLARRRGDGGS